jgi:hypothetical protein
MTTGERVSFFVIRSVAAVALLLAASTAGASNYQGYGDTGWTHDNKRDCCDDAGWLAQDESAWQCEQVGGHPKIPSGSVRAHCDWDSRGSGRDRVYRCTATTSVYCR